MARSESADKIGQELREPLGRRTSYDGEEQSESLKCRGQKKVGDCLVKVVVEVQVGWERVCTNFLVVKVVVVGDGGSLERDVSAANRRARVEDRDCFLRFPR